MARFSVTDRLADGGSAVEHTQTYVWACHVLGYQHPDLTMHGEQVRDLYGSEEGLDLAVLDDDYTMLRAAADASSEALGRQRALLADLTSAWRGPGADLAAELLQRHCGAAETVTAAVRGVAERWAALPDELWQLVDRKVATAIAIDDRRLAQRTAWLAAAHAVTSGAADRAAAEVVDQQVVPYVDFEIAGDWLSVMRSTPASIDAAFDAVIDAAAATPAVRFELPGDFATRLPPLFEPLVPIAAPVTAPATAVSAGCTPVAGPPPSSIDAATPPTAWDQRSPIAPPPPAPADATGGSPPASPLWDSGLGGGVGLPAGGGDPGGLGGLAGSISSIIGQIVDGIGGLLGSLTDGLADSSMTDDAALDGLDADDRDSDPDADSSGDESPEEPDDEPDTGEPAPVVDDAEPESGQPPDPLPGEPTAEEPAPPIEPAPTPDPPPPTEAVPPPSPEPDQATPCEIAADALPQAGQ